jgi:hypothetical protein
MPIDVFSIDVLLSATILAMCLAFFIFRVFRVVRLFKRLAALRSIINVDLLKSSHFFLV